MGRRARPWIVVCVLGLALAALGCDQANPNLSEQVVTGYVLDSMTGEGIGGATVTFTSDTLYTARTRSRSNGYYGLSVQSDVPLGRVRAEKAGYTPRDESVFFDTNEVRKDVPLTEAAAPSP